MLVFLIGFMGAGKTTLGKAVAAQLGWYFFDLDKEIERHSGCSVPQLFADDGEAAFRKMEQQVLHHFVEQFQKQPHTEESAIIACGGGTPCFRHNLAFMKANGFVIYLEVTPEILCERLLRTHLEERPVLSWWKPEQLLENIRNLLDKRRPIYEMAHWKC